MYALRSGMVTDMAGKKRSGLGRGIEAYFTGGSIPETGTPEAGNPETGIPEADISSGRSNARGSEKATGEAVKVRLSKVEPNRDQPRRDFDEEALNELASSIRKYGVLQPILVQDRGDRYEIIAGERRWRAARLAGLTEIPVIIRNYTENEILQLSLIENLQREDLNPMEEAAAYRRLIDEFGLKQEEAADSVGKSRTAVANSLRLLKLSDRVRDMVSSGELSAGHGRALLAVTDEDMQQALADRIVREGLSVREAEKLSQAYAGAKKPKKQKEGKKDASLELIYRRLEDKMERSLGTKVAIRPKGKGGRIEIEFYSGDDLERITGILI